MDNIEKLIPAEWSPLTWREQGIGDAAFRAGMRAAAEIAHLHSVKLHGWDKGGYVDVILAEADK